MLFYFVRHGQTEANRQEILAGSGLDIPLNEEGHRQAEVLAKAIREHIPHPVRRIVASDMIRARQTAEYLAATLGMELEFNPDFREWHLGEWEGQPFANFGHLILGDGEPNQGEPRRVFYERVQRAWTAVHSDEPYLVVAHGAVWLALQDLLKIPRFKVHNCHLVRLKETAGIWRAEILNP